MAYRRLLSGTAGAAFLFGTTAAILHAAINGNRATATATAADSTESKKRTRDGQREQQQIEKSGEHGKTLFC
jgi:hypothetical protein